MAETSRERASGYNGLINGVSSSLYSNPSDNPSTVLVSKCFDGTGFGISFNGSREFLWYIMGCFFSKIRKYDGRRSNVFYDYCKKLGHVRDKCFKLHRYHTNYKIARERRVVAQVQAEISGPKSSIPFSDVTQIPKLTKAQYN